MFLRQEVARAIVLMQKRGGKRQPGPVVPSTVPYEEAREGNDPCNALAQRTHGRKTGIRTVRNGCVCQHQGGAGPGWMVWPA
jgi:hypothetical protein